jgi:ectoine hydroxylase-related dioxygenase (phytanoyl-CoA dioxygenase family)
MTLSTASQATASQATASQATASQATVSQPSTWLTEQDCDLDDFRAMVEQVTDPRDYPTARAVEQNVPVYDAEALRERTSNAAERLAVQAELARLLLDGPGVMVIERAFHPSVVDRATSVLRSLLDEERTTGKDRGDYFAKPGTNERLWDSLGKLAVRDPEVFVDYFANDAVALVSAAWLGPGYQITAQVNVVNPGGAAQTLHRDYHLGFASRERAASFPGHVHRLSPVLTLQGAVAHCNMPVESGPTLYLPYSQKYVPGYLAWRLPQFCAYADEHHIQLPLSKGDLVFFNPALFHGAGENRSDDIERMANLLQISSTFGRAMESVDRDGITNAVYPVLLQRKRQGADEAWLANVVAACAEGYAFPTNLDLDSPVDRVSPLTPAEITWRALEEDWSPETLQVELRAAADRRKT